MDPSKISILGSTGSIGRNTIKVLRHLGSWEVEALAAGKNCEELLEQIEEFEPRIVSVADEETAIKIEGSLATSGSTRRPEIFYGNEGMERVAGAEGVSTVVSAAVGAIGLRPTLKAIEAGRRVALANKETLVMAGDLMTTAARESGAEILPVDSEHNAIHQCLRGETNKEVRRLILTASGGPFRTKPLEEIRNATVEDALAHPTWKMGRKISIDSATLMNKGLEVIEARWLFGFGGDQISVLVHPQSVIHSMVEFLDGSVIAQMGVTDMRHPIQYALSYPERLAGELPPLDLAAIGQMDFEEPDLERFPNLRIAFEALALDGTAPAVLNAANEIAVQAFLDRKISLAQIAEINESVLNSIENRRASDLETVLDADGQARKIAAEHVAKANVQTASLPAN
ncbi:MAG: 1-deoxy-D-xylulose-5-phosphate reductoisomerase [Pyrinomonadaceae bacterium]